MMVVVVEGVQRLVQRSGSKLFPGYQGRRRDLTRGGTENRPRVDFGWNGSNGNWGATAVNNSRLSLSRRFRCGWKRRTSLRLVQPWLLRPSWQSVVRLWVSPQLY
ncbi:hypothetical protein HZH66_003809 [Vespula vulgaris]|uniref:Uncharacterized protein n=2 Tax=Vespula TaxID=7451 RepID=A0A834P7W9_VESPE|nr:hypothetical protein HZH66_003809 [Vespula vulgaris]KAF7431707.1 hypothetical protein H0235_004631 [Vespula pensylvanica]